MTIRSFLSSAAIVLAILGSGPVKAADLDPALEDPVQEIPSLPLSNVLFGSGWYVRGDFGGTQLLQASPATQGILSINPTSTFHSYAPGINFTPSHEIGYTASVGGGYAFNKWIRADAVFDFLQPIHSSSYGKAFACQNGYGPVVTLASGSTTAYPTYGTCNGIFQANLQSYSALVNGYIDLGTWYNVTPYVGAGVGLSFGHYQTSSSYFQADGSSYDIQVTNPASAATYSLYFDRTLSGNYYNPAFALVGGVAIGIYDHVKLDVGYRYLDLGDILGKNVHTQEVRAGFRYMIDN